MIEIEDKNEWNNKVLKCTDYNFYQSFEWGQVKKDFGWRVKRFIEKENEQFALAQVLEKKVPLLRVKLIWIPGGPFLSDVNNTALLGRLIKNMERTLGTAGYLIRYNQQIARTPDLADLWQKLGYIDPFYNIAAKLNVILDFGQITSLEHQSHPKFKYCIRKAKQNCELELSVGADELLEDALSIYTQMIKTKKIKQDYEKVFVKRLFTEMKGNIQIVMAKLHDVPVSCALIICFGDKAFYLLGASNEIGRKHLSSYLIFDYIQKWCRQKNIRHFDLCGIDSLRSYGTYNFKKRTGGKIVEYIGEKEKASSSLLRLLCNLGFYFKGIGR